MMFKTIGTDAEVFVADIESGAIESSIGLIKGTKKKPQPTRHGFIQKDNILAEFNSTPASNVISFIDSVEAAMGDLQEYLFEYGKAIKIQAHNFMEPKWLEPLEAQQFGCDPDLNVWNLDKIHKVNAGTAGNLRTAAAHVHIGIREPSVENQIALAMLCDLYLGIPSLKADADDTRRRLYGQAGHFRPKNYGIEYRVLSNFWLADADYMAFVFYAAKKAANNLNNYGTLQWCKDNGDLLQTTINNRDIEAAKAICQMFEMDMW